MTAGETDWYALAAFVAKHAPGFGDVMAMPIDRMLLVVKAVSEMVTREYEAQAGRHRVT